MSTCAHLATEAVTIQLDSIAAALREAGTVVMVARVCTDCLATLPRNWGCTDCEWIETTTLGLRSPTLLPGLPCPAHQ